MFLKITKVFILVACLASAISFLINLLPSLNNNKWPFSVLFFFGTGTLINFILFKQKSAANDFVVKIMLTSMLRLLLCMIGVFVYSLMYKQTMLSFSFHFITHYLLFTGFEIYYLLRYAKSQQS